MKVLIIGSRIPWPLKDGGAIATYNLLKGLANKGLEVHYVSLNTLKHFVDEPTIEREFSFLKKIVGFKIDTSLSPLKALKNIFESSSYNVDRFTSPLFAKLLQEQIDCENYDLVHFEGLFVAQYIQKLKLRSPSILRQHNIEYQIWETLAKSKRNPFLKTYLSFLARRLKSFETPIIHHFNAVICITETDLSIVKEHQYQGYMQSIPAGIEVQNSNDGAIDYNAIYHIGSMEWMPNQEAMQWFHQDVWPLVQAKNPNLTFYMAGKNMPESYKNWQNEHFQVLGEVNNQDAFKAKKSILVVPLRSGSGIRIKTVEAMLAKKAVISSSQGALGLPVKHLENILIADSSEAFASAILRLTNDHELRNQLAENGYQFALKNYSQEAVSEQWIACYKHLLDTN